MRNVVINGGLEEDVVNNHSRKLSMNVRLTERKNILCRLENEEEDKRIAQRILQGRC